MNIDKISALLQQSFHAGLRFAFIVGIQSSVSARNLDISHAGAYGDSLEQIHSGDHGSLLPCLVIK